MAYGYGYGNFGHYNAPFYGNYFGGYGHGLGGYNNCGLGRYGCTPGRYGGHRYGYGGFGGLGGHGYGYGGFGGLGCSKPAYQSCGPINESPMVKYLPKFGHGYWKNVYLKRPSEICPESTSCTTDS